MSLHGQLFWDFSGWKKCRLEQKNHLKYLLLVSRATLRWREYSGTDYWDTVDWFSKKKNESEAKPQVIFKFTEILQYVIKWKGYSVGTALLNAIKDESRINERNKPVGK